jgi:murein DD-endopeptidase MepM/ murein hydrolase activator NlpD
MPTSSLTGTSVSTTVSSPTQLAFLEGRLFFDYNGNGIQDPEEPAVPTAKVSLIGPAKFEAVTDSAGDYKIEDIPSGTYQYTIQTDKRFRYVCTSAREFRTINDISVSLTHQPEKIDIGLMEGFLTMPLARGIAYRVNAYFDEGGDTNWMGQPNGDPGHEGTDLGVPIGTPVFAAAPGVVKYIDDWGPTGIFVIVSHDSYAPNMSTLYAHLSKADVTEGRVVERGDRIGLSGEDKAHPGPHLHFELDFGFHGSPNRASRYTPTDPFKSQWNPNYIGYWTKENDPQYFVN